MGAFIPSTGAMFSVALVRVFIITIKVVHFYGWHNEVSQAPFPPILFPVQELRCSNMLKKKHVRQSESPLLYRSELVLPFQVLHVDHCSGAAQAEAGACTIKGLLNTSHTALHAPVSDILFDSTGSSKGPYTRA